MCISKFEVTDKSCKLVDFFLSPTNTTFTFMHLADAFIQSDLQCILPIHFLSVQQLHLLGSFIAGTQILLYESQIKKLVRSHVLLLLQQ